MFSEIKAHRQAGFSLIELLVVVLIIGILATIAIPSLLKQRDKAKNAGAQATVRSALTAAKSYYTENDNFSGLTAALLKAEENTLYSGDADPGTAGVQVGEPLGNTRIPGDNAVPSNIFIGGVLAPVSPATQGAISADNPGTGAGATATDPQKLVLCAVGKGDTIFCIYDDEVNGVVYYEKFKDTANPKVITVGAAAGGNERIVGTLAPIAGTTGGWDTSKF